MNDINNILEMICNSPREVILGLTLKFMTFSFFLKATKIRHHANRLFINEGYRLRNL